MSKTKYFRLLEEEEIIARGDVYLECGVEEMEEVRQVGLMVSQMKRKPTIKLKDITILIFLAGMLLGAVLEYFFH